MDKRDIIPGHEAIMPLNILDIDPIHRKQAISQHENDIKAYNQYQQELSPRLRYKNIMKRIQKIHHDDYIAQEKRNNEKIKIQQEEDTKRMNSGYKYCFK